MEEFMNAITTLKAALALALGVAAQGVLAKDGTVNFKGSIIDAPCSIMGGDANQTVDLGQISNSVLAAGGVGTRSPLVDFTIKLTGCGSAAKTARVTFAATADTANANLLAVTGGRRGSAFRFPLARGCRL
ncbi:UNVERIFIED_CONTAM: lpfA [Trichonephila clavipes]